MMHKDLMLRLPARFYVLPPSAFLLGLTLYSYRLRELLVCWLFFCSFFALLALAFLGVALACYALENLGKWVGVAKIVIPELAVSLAKLLCEAISAPRIIVAGDLKTAAGPSTSVSVLDAHSCLLIEAAPPAEISVRK